MEGVGLGGKSTSDNVANSDREHTWEMIIATDILLAC